MNPTEKLILILDDDTDSLRATAHALKQAGFLVVAAADCSAARQALELTRADLLIVRPSIPFEPLGELLMSSRTALAQAPVLVLAHPQGMATARETVDRLRAFASTVVLVPPETTPGLLRLVDRSLRQATTTPRPPGVTCLVA